MWTHLHNLFYILNLFLALCSSTAFLSLLIEITVFLYLYFEFYCLFRGNIEKSEFLSTTMSKNFYLLFFYHQVWHYKLIKQLLEFKNYSFNKYFSHHFHLAQLELKFDPNNTQFKYGKLIFNLNARSHHRRQHIDN